MQVRINSDNHLRLSSESSDRFTASIAAALERFSDRLTRVEVHLADENSRTKGGHAMRCTLEARPAGVQPVAVTGQAVTLEQAVDGAVDKLIKALSRTLDRRDAPKGRTSMAGEQQ
jgi:ribosome-associated translation inhibitor RaiA